MKSFKGRKTKDESEADWIKKSIFEALPVRNNGELWNEDGQYLTNGEKLINYKEGMEWFEDIVFISKMINEKDYLRNEVCDYLKGGAYGWQLQTC